LTNDSNVDLRTKFHESCFCPPFYSGLVLWIELLTYFTWKQVKSQSWLSNEDKWPQKIKLERWKHKVKFDFEVSLNIYIRRGKMWIKTNGSLLLKSQKYILVLFIGFSFKMTLFFIAVSLVWFMLVWIIKFRPDTCPKTYR
jgi:hypothetical protein